MSVTDSAAVVRGREFLGLFSVCFPVLLALILSTIRFGLILFLSTVQKEWSLRVNSRNSRVDFRARRWDFCNDVEFEP